MADVPRCFKKRFRKSSIFCIYSRNIVVLCPSSIPNILLLKLKKRKQNISTCERGRERGGGKGERGREGEGGREREGGREGEREGGREGERDHTFLLKGLTVLLHIKMPIALAGTYQ